MDNAVTLHVSVLQIGKENFVKFLDVPMIVLVMESVTVFFVNVRVSLDGLETIAACQIALESQVVLDVANVSKQMAVRHVETVQQAGWVQLVMTHVFMGFKSQWIVEYVFATLVGLVKDAILYVWATVHVSQTNANVIH